MPRRRSRRLLKRGLSLFERQSGTAAARPDPTPAAAIEPAAPAPVPADNDWVPREVVDNASRQDPPPPAAPAAPAQGNDAWIPREDAQTPAGLSPDEATPAQSEWRPAADDLADASGAREPD